MKQIILVGKEIWCEGNFCGERNHYCDYDDHTHYCELFEEMLKVNRIRDGAFRCEDCLKSKVKEGS